MTTSSAANTSKSQEHVTSASKDHSPHTKTRSRLSSWGLKCIRTACRFICIRPCMREARLSSRPLSKLAVVLPDQGTAFSGKNAKGQLQPTNSKENAQKTVYETSGEKSKKNQTGTMAPGTADQSIECTQNTATEKVTLIRSANGNIYKLQDKLDKNQSEALLQQHGIHKKEGDSTLLGRGGFGSVRIAKDIHSGKLVAVKIFQPKDSKPAKTEIENCQAIQQGYRLTSFFDYAYQGKQEKEFYLFMELAGDTNDLSVIYRQARQQEELDPEAIRQEGLERLRCIDELNEKGFSAHGDVKPNNFVKSQKTGLTKLVDYGLITKTPNNPYIGTTACTPPEVFDKQSSPSNKYDSFSFGITFYLMTKRHWPNKKSSNHLHVNNQDVTLEFRQYQNQYYCLGFQGSDQLKGETADEVIALALQSDPKKRKTIKELMALPYFKANCDADLRYRYKQLSGKEPSASDKHLQRSPLPRYISRRKASS